MNGRLERRDQAARELIVERVRNEFREMPGMVLTLAQASRLFGLPKDACARILGELGRQRAIAKTDDERYRTTS